MPILAKVPPSRFPKMRCASFVVLGLAVTAAVGGCAVSVPISPIKGLSGNADDVTGSIRKPETLLSRHLDAEDWRRARAAMGTALDPQGNGSLVNWENTQTGAKGSFVPVAQIYPSDDKICRAFLAKIEADGTTEDVQGTACRDTGLEWAIKDARPWKRA